MNIYYLHLLDKHEKYIRIKYVQQKSFIDDNIRKVSGSRSRIWEVSVSNSEVSISNGEVSVSEGEVSTTTLVIDRKQKYTQIISIKKPIQNNPLKSLIIITPAVFEELKSGHDIFKRK